GRREWDPEISICVSSSSRLRCSSCRSRVRSPCAEVLNAEAVEVLALGDDVGVDARGLTMRRESPVLAPTDCKEGGMETSKDKR
ncbi:Hypothetical protein FKW44_024117, partial [Caligus rogercresseyi]